MIRTPHVNPDETAHEQQILASVGEARSELKSADTKAGTLLTLVTGALAGLLAFAQSSRVPMPASVFLWLSAATTAASAFLLLFVIRPWLGDSAGILADHAQLLELPPANLAMWQRQRLRAMSGAALAKHRRLRRAVHLLITSLTLLLIGAAITASMRMSAR